MPPKYANPQVELIGCVYFAGKNLITDNSCGNCLLSCNKRGEEIYGKKKHLIAWRKILKARPACNPEILGLLEKNFKLFVLLSER